MYIESVTLQNFRCFGDEPVSIALEPDLTAFIGNNGTGKTAATQALQRMFGITSDERTVRADDFHVAPDRANGEVTERSLSIDVILAFPELEVDGADTTAVPDFFRHMAAQVDGTMKCRLLLQSTWTADGTIDGSIDTSVRAVSSFDETFAREQTVVLSPADRSRIQFVYVPAARDGARQVTLFLRGRLWRAAQWSETIRDVVRDSGAQISEQFHDEAATRTIEAAFAARWAELHGGGTHATPRFQAVETDVDQLLRNAELTFEPDHGATGRPARLLSDGQRSLLHLALTTASLDIESQLVQGATGGSFDVQAAYLPALTVLAVEEPENNLSAFYLSRIIGQMLGLGRTARVQVLMSSHAASSLSRIDPASVRYFRADHTAGTVDVRALTLPVDDTEAGAYVRQAVRAHPELYFARFVVLGEGASEELVLTAIARALDIDLDPSFVAMVPLGGRHTQHFWRLLTDLDIPHATLLDLDYGRAGGGWPRVRTACRNLYSVGVDALDGLEDFDGPDDVTDNMRLKALAPVLSHLQQHGVFFSAPLDLDMVMLHHYWDVYTDLNAGDRGPQGGDAADAVLGTGGSRPLGTHWNPETPARAEQRHMELRWYRYLFTNRSKPATHLRALSVIDAAELAAPPKVLRDLIGFVRDRVERP